LGLEIQRFGNNLFSFSFSFSFNEKYQKINKIMHDLRIWSINGTLCSGKGIQSYGKWQ